MFHAYKRIPYPFSFRERWFLSPFDSPWCYCVLSVSSDYSGILADVAADLSQRLLWSQGPGSPSGQGLHANVGAIQQNYSPEEKEMIFSLVYRPSYIWALSNLTLSVRKSISYIDQNLILGTRHLPADIDDINIDEDGELRKQSFSFYAESRGPFLVRTFSLCVINIFPLFLHCTSFETWTSFFSQLLHTVVGDAIYLCSSIE